MSSVIEQSAISTSNGAKDVIAIAGTLARFGSCSREPPDVFMLLLQMFLGTMAVTTTVLTAAVSERQLVQDELHRSEWELTDFFESAAVGIHAMALIYKSLYQSHNMANLGAGDYLRRLSQLLFEVYHLADGRITLKLDLETVAQGPHRAIPCGLLFNELLSNCLRHAFPNGQTGEIYIALHVGPEQVTLGVRHTGVGFPEGLDFQHTNSLGLHLVYLLSEQLGGTITLERTAGTTFTLTLPLDPSQERGKHHGQHPNSDC